jgi:hypothetical protein
MTIITVDSLFVYLCQQESWTSEMLIAMELGTSIPITQNLLTKLGDVVESDRAGNWRIMKTSKLEVVSEDNSDLTLQEEKDLLQLERRVEKGFYIAGKALQEIRNKKLYRKRYRTFSDYCKERFSFSYRNANYLIVAVEVMDNLLTIANQKMGSNASQKNFIQFLPTSTRQTLPLSKLPPDKQLSVWQKAISLAPNGKPTGKLVSMIVDEINTNKKMSELSQGEHLHHRLSRDVSNQLKEGLNYKAGLGCEWNVKVEESTYKKLREYQLKKGLPSLDSAIVSLLASGDRDRFQ